jgi:nucleotide-binding universal stress UspA family protein
VIDSLLAPWPGGLTRIKPLASSNDVDVAQGRRARAAEESVCLSRRGPRQVSVSGGPEEKTMSVYKHILVPLDGSSTADRGLREAIRLACELKSKLRLLQVIDDFPMLAEMSTLSSFEAGLQRMREYGESVLTRALAQATEAGVEAQTLLREVTQGRIADILIEEAGKAACDLIVMGTHGRRGLSRLALGSDADRVARSSPVPVLLVRGSTTS